MQPAPSTGHLPVRQLFGQSGDEGIASLNVTAPGTTDVSVIGAVGQQPGQHVLAEHGAAEVVVALGRQQHLVQHQWRDHPPEPQAG